jgi:hypothetical protein
MKESSTYIKGKINDLFEKFPTLKIRYEFRATISTHLIEVLPIEQFESDDDYISFEMAIENEFEELFGIKEEILFISSDSLNQIRDIHYSLGYDEVIEKVTYSFGYNELTEEISTALFNANSFQFSLENITHENTSYRLAA